MEQKLTPWTFLFALLVLLPLGELVKRLGGFLQFGDEVLDVIQDVVQDFLSNKKINYNKIQSICLVGFRPADAMFQFFFFTNNTNRKN